VTPAIHASAVAMRCPGGWRGALLRGPSGTGKSDLALRLIGRGWRLIGDDYVHVWRSGDAVHARAAERIAGRIEARGLGIVPAPNLWVAPLVLVVDCVQAPVERMPEPEPVELCGLSLPRLTLDVRPQSAVNILTLMMVGL